MRIVLLTRARTRGGVWRHVTDLAGGLRTRGHEVVIGLHRDADDLREAAARLDLPSVSLGQAILRRADVWHLHLHDTFDTWAPLALAARRPMPGVRLVTEHLPRSNASDSSLIPGPRRRGATAAKGALKSVEARLLDHVIAVSGASATFLAGRYGWHAPLVEVIPNGIRAGEDAPPPPAPTRPMHVVALGDLGVQKGHDVLMAAASRSAGEWSVEIVGEGSSRPTLEALARTVTGGRARLSGWRTDAGAAITDADVVCVPSRWEAWPYVALEAMAMARPVVASSVDGLAEIVDDGTTGLLVPPDDPLALAAALDGLAADPHRRAAMGRAGRVRVETLFGLEEMVDATVALYARALAKHG